MEFQKPQNAEKLLAASWQEEYEENLERVLESENSDLGKLVDVVWEWGILNHLAPAKEDVVEARKNLGKEVFNRNDINLYLRLLLSVESIKEAAKNVQSLYSGFFSPAIMAWARAMGNERFFSKDDKETLITLLDKLSEKIKEKISEFGSVVPDLKYKPGDEGIYFGINVKIERITGDGMVLVKANNAEDHAKLWDYTDAGLIDAGKFFENFKLS